MVLFSAISGFLNGISVVIFGLIVWFHNPKRKVNRFFVLLCVSVAIWGVSWGFFAVSKEEITASFFDRLLNSSAIFISIFFLHWVLVLLEVEKEKNNKIILTLGYFLTLFFAIFSFTPYFFTTEPTPPLIFYPRAGIFHPFYLIFCYFGLVGYAIYKLLKEYKKAVGYKKAQLKYVLLGAVLGFGGGATNFFLFYDIPILPYGNPLVAVAFGLLSYAVIRYRLMDIRIAIGRIVAYAFSFATIIGAGISLGYLNNQLNPPLPFSIVISFIAFLSILLFQLHKFYDKLVNQYFYYAFYNTKMAIAELEERLTQVLELKTLSLLLINTLKSTFKLDKAAILTKEAEEDKYVIQQAINFKKGKLDSLIKESFFISYFERTKKLLIKEEFNSIIEECKEEKNKNELQQLRNKIENLGIEVFIPLIFENKLIGIILLGDKISREAFSNQDLELLDTLCRQASIALKNASLFAEVNKRKQELEAFYRLIINRELKMRELEKRIKELEEMLEKK